VTHDRRGATVAELAVALLLAGVAAAIGGGVLVAAERRSRRDASDSIAAQTTRETMHILAAAIASARWGSVAVRGDTALDLDSHVGISVVCASSPHEIVLPAHRTTRAEPWTVWRLPPEPLDLVAIWDSTGVWRMATVDSVSGTLGGGCAAGGAFPSLEDSVAGAPLTRLRITTPLTFTLGAPVRVYRPERWTIYRGGDRQWWFGQRRCPMGECGAAQPVSGPLSPPADSGLRFRQQSSGEVSVRLRPAATPQPPVARGNFAVRGAPDVER
jgi:hypothetical protein